MIITVSCNIDKKCIHVLATYIIYSANQFNLLVQLMLETTNCYLTLILRCRHTMTF